MHTTCFVSFVMLWIKFPKNLIQSIMSCETSLGAKCWPYILNQWEVIRVCWNWRFPLVFVPLAQNKGEWNFHQPHFGREKFQRSYFLSFPINIKNVDSVLRHSTPITTNPIPFASFVGRGRNITDKTRWINKKLLACIATGDNKIISLQFGWPDPLQYMNIENIKISCCCWRCHVQFFVYLFVCLFFPCSFEVKW